MPGSEGIVDVVAVVALHFRLRAGDSRIGWSRGGINAGYGRYNKRQVKGRMGKDVEGLGAPRFSLA